MKRVKQAFDPKGLLNPGKIFPTRLGDGHSGVVPGPNTYGWFETRTTVSSARSGSADSSVRSRTADGLK